MKHITKKILILTFITAAWLMLSAFTLKSVKLKNADQPFIDLGMEVVDSEIGVGGNSETGLEGEAEAEVTDETAEITIIIDIQDRTINLNGIPCSTIDDCIRKLKSMYDEGMSIVLVDDYAEAYTYMDMLEALKKEGFEFTEQVNE